MKAKSRICLMCNGPVDVQSLSFEQRLINDTDFCRTCWEDIMAGEYLEASLPVLVVEGR